MAIEFSCPHCHHVLRTADDKAGLSAKCPACSEIIWVPLAGSVPAGGSSTAATNDGGYALSQEQPVAPPPENRPAEPDEAAAWAEVKCPNCSAANSATAQACRFCGSSLAGAEAVSDTPAFTARTPDIGEVFSTTWRIYSSRFGLLIGATFLILPLGLVMLAIAGLPMAIILGVVGNANDEAVAFGSIAGTLCAAPLMLAMFAPLVIGVMKLHLNIASGANADIGDLLYGFGPEGRTLIPGMLLIIPLGMLSGLLIIGPMLIWPLAYMYVDKRRPIVETFSLFFNRLSADFAFVLLIGLILYAIGLVVGFLTYPCFPCCFGLLLMPFVTPFENLMTAVGYLRWSGQRTLYD